MKIKILKNLPVQEKYRPAVGSIYDVVRTTKGRDKMYFIKVDGHEVGVFASNNRGECRVINAKS